MPTLSMFYGILIRMYYDDHNPPHIHAIYGDCESSFDLDGNVIDGELPRKQRRLVTAWIEIHRDELAANWELARNEEPFFKIEPLK
jgi:hypothetical protein